MTGESRFSAIILCTILFSLQNTGYAQGLRYPPKQNPLKLFASTVSGDVWHVLSSPLHLKRGEGLKLLGLTAVTTVFLASLDNTVDDNFIERNDFHVIPAVGLAKVGEGYNYVLAGLSVSMLAGGLIFKDKKLLVTTRLMVESYIIAGAITQIGKRVFGRERPFESEGPSEFEWFQLTASASHSFPSGHTAGAFSVMTVLAKQYDSWWIKIPAYTIALSVAFQRIDSRNHWGTDVIVGGAIGYWVGSALVNRYRRQSNNSFASPYIFVNRVGVIVRL
jgi:membrane-associated phospholipid phosphatase